MVAPSTPAAMAIGLNATPVADGSSSEGQRKCPQEIPTDMHPEARNLFSKMPPATNDEAANHSIIENIIFKGGAATTVVAFAGSAGAAPFDPAKTQS